VRVDLRVDFHTSRPTRPSDLLDLLATWFLALYATKACCNEFETWLLFYDFFYSMWYMATNSEAYFEMSLKLWTIGGFCSFYFIFIIWLSRDVLFGRLLPKISFIEESDPRDETMMPKNINRVRFNESY
jgi:hypothetical protein